ncbi:MAG: MBL fold metallo-hydrolase [Anaerolineae bacterium]|jgi:7,8-dihydropterin-6-yl-methyl-4-(beta-D-ribofuranosyl)aminobenzene 5'-phosphate synthase
MQPVSPTHTVAPSPTATSVSTPTPSPTVTPEPTVRPVQDTAPTKETKTLTFTVAYDNNTYDERLTTSWGFACWVETEEATVLFDTGGDGARLLGNTSKLGLDLEAIDVVVLSHAHGDHTGGLGAMLGAGIRPTVYVPASFSALFKSDVRAHTNVVEVTGPMEVAPGVHTTGEIGSGIIEQALAVETKDGLVVVTGCAHPGIVKMVRRARQSVDDDVALVMGGFHLDGASRERIERIIGDFREMRVRRVAPCHCTGDSARRMFADAFGAAYVPAGVGWSVALGVAE